MIIFQQNTDKTRATKFATRQMGSDQHSSPATRISSETKESEDLLDVRRCPKQNVSGLTLHMEPTTKNISDSNESNDSNASGVNDLKSSGKLGATMKDAENEKEESITNTENENEKTDEGGNELLEKDKEKESEEIVSWFFPSGDETYSIQNIDNIAEMLERFQAEDLEN